MYPESRPYTIREFPDLLAQPATPGDQATYDALILLAQRYELQVADILRHYLATSEFTPTLLQSTLIEKGLPTQLAVTAIRVAISHMIICFGLYQFHHFHISHPDPTAPSPGGVLFRRKSHTSADHYLSQIGEFAVVIPEIQAEFLRQLPPPINL